MSMRSAAVVAGLALGLMSGTAKAATFDIGFGQGDLFQGLGSLSGTLTTANSSGSVSRSDVTSYDLTISTLGVGGLDSFELTPANSALGSANLSIVGSELLFTFTPTSAFSVFDSSFNYSFIADGGFGGATPNITITTRTSQIRENYISGTSIVLGTLSPVSTVPLPASAPLFGAALLGLAGLGYAAKRKKEAAAA